jgi:hypothetical protein
MRIRNLLAALILALALHTVPAPAQTRTAMNYQGAFAGGTTYQKGDSVASAGAAYVSIVSNNTGNTPASSPSDWAPLGSAGGSPSGPNGSIQYDDSGAFGGFGNYNASDQTLSVTNVNTTTALTSNPQPTGINMIFDDDNSGDVDGMISTFPNLFNWANVAGVNVLAIVADSANVYAAPTESLIAKYYGHGTIPIGANQTSVPANQGSTSAWAGITVTQFCPSSGFCPSGDTRANYPACVVTLRTALANPNVAASSVAYVETGFMTCLAALMASPADGISSLTGAQLLKAKVATLDIMGGGYPDSTGVVNVCNSNAAEYNLACDPADANYVMTHWTSQNGYPPMYLNGYANGDPINSGLPFFFPLSNPGYYAGINSYGVTRPSWDVLSMCHAVLGNTNCGFTVSASGTNTVDASTGVNSWSSSTASGQYVITTSQPTAFYQAILDGLTNNGGAAQYPLTVPGTIVGDNGIQTNSLYPQFLPNAYILKCHGPGCVTDAFPLLHDISGFLSYTGGGGITVAPTATGANAGYALTPQGGDAWQIYALGSGMSAIPHVMFFSDLTSGVIPLQLYSHSGVNTVATVSNGVLGFNSSTAVFDTGFSRDSAGVVDLGNGSAGDKSGSLNLTNLTVTGTCTGCGGSGGSMTWPAAAGIAVYGGSSAWGTSLTAPTGAIVGAGQANTYSTGLQDFSSVTMKFPSSVTVGANSITLPVSAGTLALVSQLPSVGTWGALAYPSWASGTPFVKMTAAGTFSLDTNTYQAAGTYVTPTTLDNNTLPGSFTTATVSGLSTLKAVLPTGVTVAALPGSGNTNYEQYWVTDPTSLADCTVGSSSGFAHACMWNGSAWVTALPVQPVTLGGTGLATLTAHSLQIGEGTSSPNQMAVCGTGVPVVGVTSGDPICSASGALGTNAFNSTTIPAAQVAANLASSGATGVTGILPGANGGTGVANTGVTETFAANFTTTGTGAPTLAFPATTSYTYTHPAATGTLVEETASDTTTTHVLHASATNGVGTFSAIVAGDLPGTLTSGTIIPAAGMTPQSIDCHTACSPTAAQLSNAQASNYGQTTANVSITGPTVAAGMNFLMIVGTAQASYYWRYSSTTANIYLDGSGTAVTNIIFAAPAVGNSFSCFSFQTGSSTYSLKCTTLAGVSTSS